MEFAYEEFSKERSFIDFKNEMEILVNEVNQSGKNMTQEHFRNLLKKHFEESTSKSILDLYYPLFLVTHFTQKQTVCLQFLINKLDFDQLFDEYKNSNLDQYSQRMYWEIFLQAISRKMVAKSDAKKYLETFLSDFVNEQNDQTDLLVFEEKLFSGKNPDLKNDLINLRKMIDEGKQNSLFKNLWLFDKKLVEMMIVYFFVSIDLQGK